MRFGLFVHFPDKLQRLLGQRNLTLDSLGSYIGVAHTTIGRWARGASRPFGRNAQRLAEFFEIPVDLLLDDTKALPTRSTAVIEEERMNFLPRSTAAERLAGVVAPHRGHSPPPPPATRADCEQRLAEILDLAEKFPDGLGIVRSDLTATKNEIRKRLAAHEESEQL